MRRLTLTVFLCLAACGGGARNPSTGVVDRSGDMRAAQEFLLTSDAGLVIAEFAKVYSQAQLDTCLAAYVDDFGGPSGSSEPVSKPDVKGFRNFLAQCLGAPVPGDARGANPVDARTLNGRSDGGGATVGRLRSDKVDSLRTIQVDSMRFEASDIAVTKQTDKSTN